MKPLVGADARPPTPAARPSSADTSSSCNTTTTSCDRTSLRFGNETRTPAMQVGLAAA